MNRKSIGSTIPAALLMILFCFTAADAQGFLPGGGTGLGSGSNVPLNNQAVHAYCLDQIRKTGCAPYYPCTSAYPCAGANCPAMPPNCAGVRFDPFPPNGAGGEAGGGPVPVEAGISMQGGGNPKIMNLAGAEATCLKDPAQLDALERERAMLSDRAHRPLTIIALSRDDAEPLTRGRGALLACRSCGVSSNEIWVCIGDASEVRDALAQKGGGGTGNFDPQAKSLAQAQRWRELQGVAGQWRLSSPNSAPAFFYSGLAAENLGDEKIALSYYGQAVALDPQLGAAQFGYARSLMRDGSYQQAIAPLQIVVRDFPSIPRAWGDLGVSYMHSGNAPEAVRALQHAVDLDPSDLIHVGLAGQAYALNHQLPQAAQMLEKAIQKQPFDNVNLNWMDDLGGIYHNLGDYQRSAQVFDATLRLDSSDPNTWYYLWQDYSQLGQTAKAQQAHQNMIRLTTPKRPVYASRDPMAAIIRGQNEAYLHNMGQLNLNKHLP
jgi:tetratricopeptide (TPR) repeat protein